jgi:hypothetical protein
LLNTVADLIDSKIIKTTLTEVLSPINAENLRKAHRKLESGTTIGKIVYLASKLSLLSNHEVPNISYQDDNNFFSINTSAL